MIDASPDRLPVTPAAESGPDPSMPNTGTLVALVAHARAIPSIRREAFGDLLRRLPDDPRRIIVRTCHRVELYATGGGAELPDLAELPPGIERLQDVDAVRHLLTVACGLDSAVFGETQILHQLRETLEARRSEAPLDPILERLFQVAFRAGREARGYVTGSPRSLADVALDRIAGHASSPQPELTDRPILVVGVGRMARLAAFAATRRGHRILIMNRTASRAAELAAEVDGRVVPFASDGALGPIGGAVVAISGPWPLGREDLATIEGCGATIVDLSSPPALAGDAIATLGERFVSVDELADAGGPAPDERTRSRLERVVSRAGAEYCQWLRNRHSVPAIRGVVRSAEERRADEMAWLRRRLPGMTQDELAVVEQMSHRLVAALLHAPLSALTADQDGDLEHAARELFGL